MKHKKIILILLGVLVLLFVLKAMEPTKYPLTVKNVSFGKTSRFDRLTKIFLKERPTNSEVAIKWDSFAIGDTEEQVKRKVKATTDTNVVLLNDSFPCTTIFSYNSEGYLVGVRLSFNKYMTDLYSITNDVLALYGKKHLFVYEKVPSINYNLLERYSWICDNCLVLFEKSISGCFLCIIDMSDLSDEDLRDYFRYGRISISRSKSTNDYSESSSSYSRTYKYGDSDIYQGSSQQKADLEAIDNYFSF